MNNYEKREKRAELFRKIQLAVYMHLLDVFLEDNDYEELDPLKAIKVCQIVTKHSKLQNRFEG